MHGSAAPGGVSPSVTTDTAGTALVFGEGSNSWGFMAQAPYDTGLAATNNDGRLPGRRSDDRRPNFGPHNWRTGPT